MGGPTPNWYAFTNFLKVLILAAAVGIPNPVKSRLRRPRASKSARRESLSFHLMILPWLIGFCGLMLYPIVASAYFSLTRYDVISPPRWVGLGNYVYLFTRDPLFWRSLGVTFTYTLVAVPLNLALALVLAMLLNLRVPGMRVLRTVYYLPTVMPQVATSMLWMFLFAPTFGVIDWALAVLFHITGPNWLSDPHWVMPAFILMSLWGVGGAMVIFLAGLQSVPPELYEAAQLDGASGIVQFVRVTLPSISPVVLFNLIVGMIGAMQIFTTAFVMTQGGPDYASYFFNLAIYNNAFVYFKMGLASAQAWVLLLIVMIMTLVVFATSSRWVFYGSGR